jgi:hypothetical protein
MKSKHTLPTVTAPWTAQAASGDLGARRTTGNLDAWVENAPFWDKAVGTSGNDMYQELVLPCVESLAELTPGMGYTALDLATGNGIGARKLRLLVGSGNGSRVVASDGCEELLHFAQDRERAGQELEGEETGKCENGRIEYERLDLMDGEGLELFAKKHAGCGFALDIHVPRERLLTIRRSDHSM